MAIDKRSIKKTLLVYLAYVFFLSSVLTILVLLAEYTPFPKNDSKRIGIAALTLDSILWSLFLTIMGSTSLLNQYKGIREHFLLSLLAFLLLPSVSAIIILTVTGKTIELFGFAEAAVVYFVSQLFFFFRFRSCLKRPNPMTID